MIWNRDKIISSLSIFVNGIKKLLIHFWHLSLSFEERSLAESLGKENYGRPKGARRAIENPTEKTIIHIGWDACHIFAS